MIDNEKYKVKMHDEFPIMMTAFEESFVFVEDAMGYSADVKAILDAQETPVFYLFDLTKWSIMSFDDLIKAAAQAARGKETNFHHPMNRCTLIVTNDISVTMSAQNMTGATYGNANIKIFNSVADAFNYAKSEIEI